MIRKREFATVGTHGSIYSRLLFEMLEPDRNRIHIGGHRRGACRLSVGSGLQYIATVNGHSGMLCEKDIHLLRSVGRDVHDDIKPSEERKSIVHLKEKMAGWVDGCHGGDPLMRN